MNKRNNDIKELNSIVAKVKEVLPVKNNIDKLQDLFANKFALTLQQPFQQLMAHQEKCILDNDLNLNAFFEYIINAVNVKLDINTVLRLLTI